MSIKTIPTALRKEFVRGRLFKLAMLGFKQLCRVPEPQLAQMEMLEECYCAMRERFGRDKTELKAFVDQFGGCMIVHILLADLKIGKDDGASCVPAVNTFAADHIAGCRGCARDYSLLETVRALAPAPCSATTEILGRLAKMSCLPKR